MNPQITKSNSNSQYAITQSETSQSTISTKALEQYRNLYMCPITFEIMNSPCDLPCGHTFEQMAIYEQLKKKSECPLCKNKAFINEIKPNLMAKQSIQLYKRQVKRKKQKNKVIEQYQGQIYVQTLTGKKLTCKFNPFQNVQHFIQSIQYQLYPWKNSSNVNQTSYCPIDKSPWIQNLIFGGKPLNKSLSLSENGIRKQSTLFVVTRLLG